MMKTSSLLALVATSALCASVNVQGHSAMFPDGFKYDASNGGEGLQGSDRLTASDADAAAVTRCENGNAGGYPCKNIDLQSFLSKNSMGGSGSELNDIWGWTDPDTGAEIAIVGRTNGTSFVDVTNATQPVYLGFLPSHNGGSAAWRDIKTYNDHAFIVADGNANRSHGLQVFDLTSLRNTAPGSELTETKHMSGFGNAHNIAINEATGYAYIVGSNQCSGGLYMVDVSDPVNPTYAGCFSSDGYTHDAQCVVYNVPDSDYQNREVCAAYNEDTITIVDVTTKSNPQQISRTPYQGSQYTHQGWFLDDDHSLLIMNDELDEQRNGHNTTSYIYDVSDLDNPVELGRYVGPTAAIDHNLYTLNGYVFESNYRAGLRILDSEQIASGSLTEVAYFDTIPNSNSAQFSGTWSNYIYFASGNVITSDIGNGLFTLTPDWEAINQPGQVEYCSAKGNNASYEWVAKVEVGDFVNASASAGYSDFTSKKIELASGETAVTLTPGFSNSSYNEVWKIWVDLNQDGDFSDAGEQVFSSEASSGSVTGKLTIPANAKVGDTRLRVVMRYQSSPDACGSFNYGEVEDYTVTIVDGGATPDDRYENNNPVSIPDNNATGISSEISVDRTENANSVSVIVDITHTYIGDLVVMLQHPDGTSSTLHNRDGGSGNDINKTYEIDLSDINPEGQWALKVKDQAQRDTGTLNSWALQF